MVGVIEVTITLVLTSRLAPPDCYVPAAAPSVGGAWGDTVIRSKEPQLCDLFVFSLLVASSSAEMVSSGNWTQSCQAEEVN